MSVYDLKQLPYDELLNWFKYFKMRPVGWRDDFRATLTIQGFGSKVKGEQLFPSLAAIQNSNNRDSGNRQATTLKGSKMFMNMLAAQGGDKLDILKEL